MKTYRIRQKILAEVEVELTLPDDVDIKELIKYHSFINDEELQVYFRSDVLDNTKILETCVFTDDGEYPDVTWQHPDVSGVFYEYIGEFPPKVLVRVKKGSVIDISSNSIIDAKVLDYDGEGPSVYDFSDEVTDLASLGLCDEDVDLFWGHGQWQNILKPKKDDQ